MKRLGFSNIITFSIELFGLFFALWIGYNLFYNGLIVNEYYAQYFVERGMNDTAEKILKNNESALVASSVNPILVVCGMMYMIARFFFRL